MSPEESLQPPEADRGDRSPSRSRTSTAMAALTDMSSSFMSSSSNSAPGTYRRVGGWMLARRTLGITLLLVTVFLWTISNFLASSIFSNQTYDNPFFVTYINNLIFAVSAIPMFIKHVLDNGGFSNLRNIVIQAWKKDDQYQGFERVGTDDDENDQTPEDGLLVDDEGSLAAHDIAGTSDKLGFRDTAKRSLEFCMLWFFANYFAAACLEYTSVASATVLTSTSSIWTLIFCTILKIESFSIRKLIGVLASVVGVVLISSIDLSGDNDDDRGSFPHKSQAQIAIGDAMALISAIVYGIYVVVMKQRIGNEDRVDMRLFFGLVGVYNFFFLWPLFFVLHFTGIEPFEMPPTGKIWGVIMLNSIASFIADISWAYAMLLTTPLVVTVGLSLNIPVSLIGEMVQYGQSSSVLYWIGACIVVLSFIFINHESKEAKDETRPNEVSDEEQARVAL